VVVAKPQKDEAQKQVAELQKQVKKEMLLSFRANMLIMRR
jgi:hypothetical protein